MNGLFPSLADVDLTFVFLPLLSFEVAILVVNLRYFIKVLRFWFLSSRLFPLVMTDMQLLLQKVFDTHA